MSDDDLQNARRQMNDHWLGALCEMPARVFEVLGLDRATPAGDVSAARWRLAVARLTPEDPEFARLAERVADYIEFRAAD